MKHRAKTHPTTASPFPPVGPGRPHNRVLAPILTLLLAGCAATAAQQSAPSDEIRCVVSMEPTMRLVTFAPQTGLDGGVTSVFFRTLPDVTPGDLVRLAGGAEKGPRVELVEARSKSCADVAQTAAGHHGHH